MTPNIQSLDHAIWQIDTAYQGGDVAVCYLVQGGDDYALIECGTGLSVAPILAALTALEVAPEAVRLVLPTHVHLDHAGGAGGLMQALPNARLWAHPRGARHLIDPSRLVAGARAVYGEADFRRLNGEILPVPAERVAEAPDGTVLQLGDRALLIRDAPGHARHHYVVWDVRSQGFFTGDVFGLCYPQLAVAGLPFIVPTTTPVQFDPAAWDDTLAMLRGYSPQRAFLTHYGMVEGISRLADDLQQRVHAHAQIAQAHPDLDQTGLQARLGQALFADYCDAGGTLDEAEVLKVLNMDLALNAQGLLHWLQHA